MTMTMQGESGILEQHPDETGFDFLNRMLHLLRTRINERLPMEPDSRERNAFDRFDSTVSRAKNFEGMRYVVTVLCVYLNNIDTGEGFEEIKALVTSAMSHGIEDVIAGITPDTIKAMRELQQMPHFGSFASNMIWREIIQKRPEDALRITKVIAERELPNYEYAVNMLDEMDKHHRSLEEGVL